MDSIDQEFVCSQCGGEGGGLVDVRDGEELRVTCGACKQIREAFAEFVEAVRSAGRAGKPTAYLQGIADALGWVAGQRPKPDSEDYA